MRYSLFTACLFLLLASGLNPTAAKSTDFSSNLPIVVIESNESINADKKVSGSMKIINREKDNGTPPPIPNLITTVLSASNGGGTVPSALTKSNTHWKLVPAPEKKWMRPCWVCRPITTGCCTLPTTTFP